MTSIQNGSNQDYFVRGQVGDMHYLGVMDGHGRNACIDYVRTLDFDYIAAQPDPAQVLWDKVQTGGNFYGSGCTFTFARITDVIEVWNVGDSMTHVYVNGQVFVTKIHTFMDPSEIERTKPFIHRLEHKTAACVISNTIQDVPSITGHFLKGDVLVPSQSYGHNGATGFAPHKQVISYKPTDRIRIVCVSDGVTDMNVALEEGSAEDIAKEADRKWRQPWIYHGRATQYKNIDDVACVVWENTVVEFPTLCIPYAPAVFTEAEVRGVFDDLGYIRKVEEILVKDHKVFFVHFNPGVLNPTMREMYTKLAEDKPVKVWVRERWFWNIRLTNIECHVKTVKKVGWQYDRWDGTGDYYEFADDEIPDNTTNQILQFLAF